VLIKGHEEGGCGEAFRTSGYSPLLVALASKARTAPAGPAVHVGPGLKGMVGLAGISGRIPGAGKTIVGGLR